MAGFPGESGRRFLCLAFCAAAVLVLGGCAFDKQAKGRDGFVEASYAAADALHQQSRAVVTPQTPVFVSPLADIDHPGEVTPLGHMIAGQVAARLVQLGYNVSDSAGQGAPPQAIAPASGMAGDSGAYGGYGAYGNYGASPAAGMPVSGPVNVTGQYAAARRQVLVMLRLNDSATGRVIAAGNYSIPYDRDIRELAKTRSERESFFGWF